MNAENYEKYSSERARIIKEYKQKKLKATLTVLAIGAAALAIVILMGVLKLFNIAVVLVLCAVIVMATVIIARMRAVTVQHTADNTLRQFEDRDPNFY